MEAVTRSGVQSFYVGGFCTRTLPTSQNCVMAQAAIMPIDNLKATKNFGVPPGRKKGSLLPD